MRITFTIPVMALLLAGSGLAAERVGWVTDEKCANAGKATNADHAQCAQTCVKGGEAIVFFDEASGRVFKIKNPDSVKDVVGKKVTVVGERVGPGEVEISSVQAGG